MKAAASSTSWFKSIEPPDPGPLHPPTIQEEELIWPGKSELDSYKPFPKGATFIMTQVMQVKDGETALKFVNQYGFPNGNFLAPLRTKELIDFGFLVRALYDARRARDAKQINRLLGTGRSFNLKALVKGAVREPRATFTLQPMSLDAAMNLALAEFISEGSTWRSCPECERHGLPPWFEVGPGKPRNRKARFCSRQHDEDFHNAKPNRNKSRRAKA
jgi:hypothetical protein